MLKARDSLTLALRKTLQIQAVLTGVAAIIALLVKSPGFAMALVYGGAVTSIGTGLHAWRLLKIAATGDATDDIAHESKKSDPIVSQASAGIEVVKGALLKYAAIMGLLALGMGYLKLDPLAVLIGFSVAYVGFVFSGGYAPRSKPRS